PEAAFATALYAAEVFRKLSLTIWMTATATSPLTEKIRNVLDAVEVVLSQEEQSSLFEGRGISRTLQPHWGKTLCYKDILVYKERRVLVVVNTVGRAQALFDQIEEFGCNRILLHSRFFSDDRRKKQAQLRQWQPEKLAPSRRGLKRGARDSGVYR